MRKKINLVICEKCGTTTEYSCVIDRQVLCADCEIETLYSKGILKKKRYEYYKGTNTIIDNEVDEYIEDVVDRLNFHDDANKELIKINELQSEKIADLKIKLEEKDKEIKQLKLDLGMFKSVNEFINHYGIDKAREVLLQSEKTKKQDKISFTVEQLEKVRDNIHLLHTLGFLKIEEIDKSIDNQIKELKGD
jgi:hypothetical protein